MTPGRIAYLLYHRPLGVVRTCIREGGPIEQWKTEMGRREMEAAAWRLPSIGPRDQRTKRLKEGQELAHPVAGTEALRDGPRATGSRVKGPENSPLAASNSPPETAAWRLPSIVGSGQSSVISEETGAGGQTPENRGQRSDVRSPTSGRPVEVQVLTGKKFWYQTAFCLWSFAKASGRAVTAVIHDDGSLDQRHADVLLRIFPGSRVETRQMIGERLDNLLPASKFPTLRARRSELPLIKKITDIHLGRTGWRLFFDADLLFFRNPDELLKWWDNPSVPLTSVDAAYAYGYTMELLNEVAGKPVYDFINTGLLGLESDSIDWEQMEYWCRALIEKAGTSYYQEQALIALQLAGSERVVLPREDYLVYPRDEEAADCRAVMHHYVDLSKRSYFRDNWKRALAGS